MMKYKRYKKELGYSYTFGIYPTIELLKYKHSLVEAVVFDEKITKQEGFEKILSLCKENHISYEYDSKFFKTVAGKDNVFAAGIFRKYEAKPCEHENSIVLINPSDGGNLGAIIRTMVGFNVKNLYLIKPAVDVFNPEVVRASMGALFQIGFKYFENFNDLKKVLPDSARNIYCFDKNGVDLRDVDIKKPFTLVFGSEGAGLDKGEFGSGCSIVSIPMSHSIDSYNLAVSAGVALFEFSKDR